ncbi:hypothetical protein SCLCIDRAFT_24710 [Scleroderma citrinum Foug A]|uniref:Uncharacterized protein n=1 Tax=Scleroderma citrinum Foug A TaxID=1036808 RepID=A0A0C2ZMT1_9AGAM|nr:hypothetical protein SCLCIDRAFT_24710 [Scleroderma citrinum Foug A]
MANEAGVQRGPSTLWNDAETIALIDGLFAHCAQRADSGNFRDPVYCYERTEVHAQAEQ